MRMTTLSDDALLDYNRQGLIPGPDESEEDFLKRAGYCLNLKYQISNDLKPELPLAAQDLGDPAIIRPAFVKTLALFDIAPEWIPLFFSNYKLSPWHGGCAWIFQVTEHSPLGAFFQLRQAFRTKTQYLMFYDRNELIAHEVSHVGRMRFEEPRFEEVLSYRTSNSPFTRWCGPIIQSSWESMLFVISLFLILVIDISLASFQQEQALEIAMWAKAMPAGLILLGLFRLYRKHSEFNSCLERLKTVCGTEQKANAAIYRLQDSEIIAFGKMMPEEIVEYARGKNDLRWRLITLAYMG